MYETLVTFVTVVRDISELGGPTLQRYLTGAFICGLVIFAILLRNAGDICNSMWRRPQKHAFPAIFEWMLPRQKQNNKEVYAPAFLTPIVLFYYCGLVAVSMFFGFLGGLFWPLAVMFVSYEPLSKIFNFLADFGRNLRK